MTPSPQTPDARAPRTPKSVSRAQRQKLTTPAKGSSPVVVSGNSAAALRRRLPSWHSLPLSALCPPDEFPMIPAVVIHCINEVAARGLLSTGIYRIPGSDKRVYGKYHSPAGRVVHISRNFAK